MNEENAIIEAFENAIRETYIKYGVKQIEGIIEEIMHDGYINLRCITSNNNARENLRIAIENLGEERVINVVKTHIGELGKYMKMIKESMKKSTKNILECIAYNPNMLEQMNSKFVTGVTPENEGELGLEGEALYGSISVGNERENQEDALLIMTHPSVKEFQLIAVADGMGGEECGEIASHIAVHELRQWFDKVRTNLYDADAEVLSFEVRNIIRKIDKRIYKELNGNGGTTLALAIKAKESTCIATVGDSCAYVYNKNGSIYKTRPDSHTQDLIDKGIIPNEEAARFHKKNNAVYNWLGSGEAFVNRTRMSNSEYTKLVLATDGIDCLSQEQIETIIRESPISEIAKRLADKALVTTSTKPEGLNFKDYVDEIPAGKDNIAVAVMEGTDGREVGMEGYRDEI